MLRVAGLLTLLTITLSYVVPDEWKSEFDNDVEILEKHGFSDDEIDALIAQDQDKNEDYSVEESKGYKECEDVIFWSKVNEGLKKGGWEGKKKGWDSESKNHDSEKKNRESDERSYRESDNDQEYLSDSDEDEEETHRHQPHDCPAPKPLDEICAEIECPRFARLNISSCGFEVRAYLGTAWAVTNMNISDITTSYIAAYTRLQNYFNGANDQEAQLMMTAPVMTAWQLDETHQVQGAILYFYIPSKFHSNLPVPTDEQVLVGSPGDFVAYDRAFGCRDKNMYAEEFKLLWEAMEKANITPSPYVAVTAEWTQPGPGAQRMEVILMRDVSQDLNGFM